MKSRQFTLIEILVSIVIIAILAGMVTAGVGYAAKRADEGKTIGLLKQVQNAFEDFKADNGYYPPASNASTIMVKVDNGNMMVQIDGCEYKFYNKNTKKNYLTDYQATSTYTAIADAWDNAIQYKSLGSHNKTSFDLWSKGENGSDSGEDSADDLTNWQSLN